MEGNERKSISPKPRKPPIQISSKDFKPVILNENSNTVTRWRELSKRRGVASSVSESRPTSVHSSNYSKFVKLTKGKKQAWERTFALRAMHKFRERVSDQYIFSEVML